MYLDAKALKIVNDQLKTLLTVGESIQANEAFV